MPETRFSICNRALSRVGGARITSFEDGSAEAETCADEYEPLVRAALCSHRWRFATRQEALALLSDPPEGRWALSYQLPSDVLLLHSVTAFGRPVIYDRYGETIATDAAGTLIADYTWRAPEYNWPPHFADAVVLRLAGTLALSLNRDSSLAERLSDEAKDQFSSVRNSDSQQQSARRLRVGRLLGGRAPGWNRRPIVVGNPAGSVDDLSGGGLA